MHLFTSYGMCKGQGCGMQCLSFYIQEVRDDTENLRSTDIRCASYEAESGVCVRFPALIERVRDHELHHNKAGYNA